MGRNAILVALSLAACQRLQDDGPSSVALEDAADVFERAYCERMFACRCEQERWFENIEACIARVHEEVDELDDVQPMDGVHYDPACLGLRVDALAELGCASTDEAQDDAACVPPCAPWHGDEPVDAPCRATDDAEYSNCARGLVCDIEECGYDPNTGEPTECTGTCADPCAPRPEDGCPSACDDASWCDYETAECRPLPGTGEACAQGFRCLPPGYCAQDPNDPTMSRCAALGELDDPCSGHAQCESGYCPAGYCARLPREGESCAGTSACADGLACDFETERCVEGDALVCTMPSGIR